MDSRRAFCPLEGGGGQTHWHQSYTCHSKAGIGNFGPGGPVSCRVLAPTPIKHTSRTEVAYPCSKALLFSSGGQSTQIKYLSKSTDTYNTILLQ